MENKKGSGPVVPGGPQGRRTRNSLPYLSTQQIAIAGICGAIGLILVLYGGFIPVPNPSGAATTMHIPAIIAGVFAGPLVGALTGLILAVSSWIYFQGIFLQMAGGNLLVALFSAFLPRILIGVIAFYSYRVFARHPLAGAVLASITGTLTNTVGVLGILYFFGDPSNRLLILSILALNPWVEIGLALIVLVPLVLALRRILPNVVGR
jgi:uncharacterized membrane protein